MGKRELEVDKPKIGIVGYGVVGKATGLIFNPDWIYDPAKGFNDADTVNGYNYLVSNSIVFVCVSTLFQNGTCDLEPVTESVSRFRCSKLIVMRSSVVPGTARELSSKFRVPIVSNPEFLREASADYDTLHPSRIVIGAEHETNATLLEQMYRDSNVDLSNCYGIIKTNTVTAELIKFVCNLLGATKVSLANEMYDVCQNLNVRADFDAVRQAISTDSRLGNGFFSVTKQRGWGGRCFPKDMEIFLKWMKDNGMESKVLEAARDANLKYRSPGDES